MLAFIALWLYVYIVVVYRNKNIFKRTSCVWRFASLFFRSRGVKTDESFFMKNHHISKGSFVLRDICKFRKHCWSQSWLSKIFFFFVVICSLWGSHWLILNNKYTPRGHLPEYMQGRCTLKYMIWPHKMFLRPFWFYSFFFRTQSETFMPPCA